MISINKTIICGNLGNDPKIIKGAGDKEFASLSIATTDRYKDKKGEWQSKTEWHSVTVFVAPLVAIIKEHLKKGDQVYLEGSLSTSKYKDEHDKDQYRTSIIISSLNHLLQFNSKKEEGEGETKESKKEDVKEDKKETAKG